MNQLATVFAQCVASGAIFASLCAAVAVPPLIWLGVRALAPTIAAMNDDPRWQAALAAGAASLPGALFLVFTVFGILEGVNSPCLHLTAGKVFYGLLAGLITATIVRAVFRANLRRRQLCSMFGRIRPASGRAAEIAANVGVPLFQVDEEHGMLLVASWTPHPGVYASTRLLRALDEVELRAALFHERAHIDRADHRIAPWLYFITDLLPLSVGALIDVYRCSREFCADRCALAHVDRTDLASALLRVASGATLLSAAGAAFAERAAMYGRLDALLRPKGEAQPNLRRRRFAAVALFALCAIGVALPIIGTFLIHCHAMAVVS